MRIDTSERVAHLPGDRRLEETLERYPDADIEVIEVKRRLNRPVIGQTRAGKPLLSARHGLDPDRVTEVVVCGEGDPAREWVLSRARDPRRDRLAPAT